MTVEVLLSHQSQGSFNHDDNGESWGGQAVHLGKKRQIFELKEPPQHPPSRL